MVVEVWPLATTSFRVESVRVRSPPVSSRWVIVFVYVYVSYAALRADARVDVDIDKSRIVMWVGDAGIENPLKWADGSTA